jgi:hypothetical protein
MLMLRICGTFPDTLEGVKVHLKPARIGVDLGATITPSRK